MTERDARGAAAKRAADAFRKGDSEIWDVLVEALARLLMAGLEMP